MRTVDDNKEKKNILVKTWNRCQTFSITTSGRPSGKSLHDHQETNKDKKLMTPEGYFPVYVGPEKQRFTLKTKYVNHPMFKMLLEDAENEYGYNPDGPITLACDTDLFHKVLAEMEAKVQPLGWSFVYGSCSPFNPSRRLMSQYQMGKGYGSSSYGPLIN
uniref:indole-3-acetic acid-induced protein ARG7-like n=1 Tax=Erigeron canadensis TaxID=72917 RepID=UPI001CB91352|nr:indole-3-acetic acid-induced protein ARG7-like [Erigeron canadensis]